MDGQPKEKELIVAKRFTDTEKWKKKFIKGLSTVHKLFFFFLLDDCDHAGIWHVEREIAELRIGEPIDIDDLKKALGKHIVEIDGGEKWFIPYFLEFQYGELNPNVNAHKSVISKLKKYKLIKKYEQFINPLPRVKDKDKDKDLDKVKEKDRQDRKDRFSGDVNTFVQYDQSMRIEFISYWNEWNKSKTSMRFEKQPTWDLGKRLARWSKNTFGDNNFQKNNNSKQSNNPMFQDLSR